MDLKKIQAMAIKDALSSNPKLDMCYGEYGENVVIIDKGIRLFVIPKDSFYVDYKKILKDRNDQLRPVEKLIDVFVKPANITNALCKHDNATLVRIDGEYAVAYVDVKLLPEYGKYVTCKVLYGTNTARSPYITAVHIYDESGDVLLGVVMPVMRFEEK